MSILKMLDSVSKSIFDEGFLIPFFKTNIRILNQMLSVAECVKSMDGAAVSLLIIVKMLILK